MMKLYACLGSGNSYKPWLALHQLGQAFDLILIDVLQGEQKSHAFLKINPLGVVPFLEIDADQRMGESNAMLWYLAHDSVLMPASRAEQAEALQWMFFEQSKLEPFLSPARLFTTILPDHRQERAGDIMGWQAGAKAGLARLDAHLGHRDFMLRSGYSIADIALFGYVHVLEEAGLSMAHYPGIARWVARVENTDGFRPLVDLRQPQDEAA
ncbi:MAG: glutathione S-transferase family protein [Sulfitobacter sp.]|jgi:glutathione S-transferase|nr:glutathione S-transferase family protein [Sulfitobacter sp.]